METKIKNVKNYGPYWGYRIVCDAKEFELVICPTHDNSVTALENLDKYYAPQLRKENPPPHPEHPYQIVIPLQPGGTCFGHCKFCNYSRQKPPLPYASPEAIVALLKTGIKIALENKIVKAEKELKFSLLKGGEISLHPNFEKVLTAIYQEFPDVQVKMSSIGSKNLNFLPRIIEYRRQHPNHKTTLQISVNSTDEEQRHKLVNKLNSKAIKLYTLHKLSFYAKKWIAVSFGRRLSLTFTLMDETICNPEILIRIFSPKDVVIRLRRMNPKTGHSLFTISKEDYKKISSVLVKTGFTVINGNPTYDEIEHYLVQGWPFKSLTLFIGGEK